MVETRQTEKSHSQMIPTGCEAVPTIDKSENMSQVSFSMPYEEALQQSFEARVITEAKNPFKIVHVNESWVSLCGFTQTEAVGKTLSIIQGPATDCDSIQELERSVKGCKYAATILLNYKKGGEPFVNFLQTIPLLNEDGEVTHFLGILEDLRLVDLKGRSQTLAGKRAREQHVVTSIERLMISDERSHRREEEEEEEEDLRLHKRRASACETEASKRDERTFRADDSDNQDSFDCLELEGKPEGTDFCWLSMI